MWPSGRSAAPAGLDEVRFRFLMKKMARTTPAITATPPMAPPTITPIGGSDGFVFVLVLVGSGPPAAAEGFVADDFTVLGPVGNETPVGVGAALVPVVMVAAASGGTVRELLTGRPSVLQLSTVAIKVSNSINARGM